MHLVYVDESGDPGTAVSSSRYFILCGLSVHHADWHEARNQLKELRGRLARLHGLCPEAEIHATEFLSSSRDHLGLNQRQRITIDAIRSSAIATTDLAGTLPVSGTVSVGNQVTSTSQQNSPINPYTLSTSQATGLIMEGPVHQFWRIANDAQACYASAIRSKLTFS